MSGPEGRIADRLTAALRTGTVLDLIPHIPYGRVQDEEEMRGWGPSHDIDADLLRDLLLRRDLEEADLDPRGLRLRGARIRGRLDLDLVNTSVALALVDCLLEHGVTAVQAYLPALRLRCCRLGHPDRPAFSGEHIRVDGWLDLDGAVVTAETGAGAVRLFDARMGLLTLGAATVRNEAGPAVVADLVQTDGDVFLGAGFSAVGVGEAGTVRLHRARIGQLDLRGASVRNPAGPALHADGLQTGGPAHLDDDFNAEGAGDQGAVRLVGARIGAELGLSGATVRNTTNGPALNAYRLETGGDAYLKGSFIAEGASNQGAVGLVAARIGDQLRLSGATLRNTAGPALAADRLQTGGDAYLDGSFTAEGAGNLGAVRLVAARIGGQFRLSGATLRNTTTGPALAADRLQTGGDAYLEESFTAEGAGNQGVIRLVSARIGGQLRLLNCAVRSRSGSSHRWQIDDLTYVGVPQLSSNGNRNAWLELLSAGTSRYAAQPYQQFAAVYRAEGHDSDVRRILMAQRRDQIARGGLRRGDRWWAKTTGLLLGYGYQPWRALLYLAGVLAMSVGLALWLGGHGGLARTASGPAGAVSPAATAAPATGVPCTLVQTVGRGLDLGAPFLPAAPAVAGSCQPTAPPAGGTLTVGWWAVHAGEAFTTARWVLQLIAWALAALFIAGFTGIVRKT